ncbi:MAG: hypothetical protein QW175_01725 [Candidatus Bathyarchaeia archaeon]
MVSEKYIEKVIAERKPPQETFYTQQRKAEYKFLPEALKAQYEGMVASYKREALSQMLPQEYQVQSKEQFHEMVQRQVELAIAMGYPPEEVQKWAQEVLKQFEQADVEAQKYAEQRVRSEAQFGLLAAGGIGAAAISPVTAIAGAAFSVSAVQARVWKAPPAGAPFKEWLKPLEPPRTVNLEEAVAAASLGAMISVSLEKIGGYVYKKLSKTVSGKQIVGATEKEFAKAAEKELGVIRETKLETRYTLLPKEAKEFERFISDMRVSFAGREYAIIKRGDEYIVGFAPYESTREADIFIRAVKSGKSTVFQKYFLGGLEFEPGAKIASRQITGVQLFGKIDPQVYLRFLKNVPAEMSQSWLKQMGGLSLPQIATLTKPIEVAITAIPIQAAFTLTPSIIGGITASKLSSAFKKNEATTMKMAAPTIPKRITRETAMPKIFEFPEIKEEVWSVPEIKMKVWSAPIEGAGQSQKITQKTVQKLSAKIQLPTTVSTSIPSSMFRIPFGRGEWRRDLFRRGKRRRDLFGWYRWDYPTLSPSKLLKSFGLNVRLGKRGGRRKR